jgi:hypothetical protein
MSAATFIVLDAETTTADVRRLARQRGWTPAGDTPRGHDVMASLRFRAGSDTDVWLGEDHTSGCRWIRIEGPSSLEVGGAIRNGVGWVRPNDVLSRLERADAVGCIRLAGQLAAVRPVQFDADHFDALRRLITHDEIPVRRAGIRSAFGCRWPQLAALVREQLQRKQRPQPGLEALLAWIDAPEADDL